ncbi:MAG: hypothetical protein IKH44_09670, partial [Bacteroidales bacterium]|nr:hypothetical protein [Bacteroidales bacterium]
VIPAMRCYRPQQLCHPSDGQVGKGMGSIAVEAVTIWFFLLCSASYRLTSSNAKHFPPTHMPTLE